MNYLDILNFAHSIHGGIMSEFVIPRINLMDFLSEDLQKKQTFSQAIGKAFTDTGFVMISQHGLSADDITLLYDQIKAFFALSNEVKQTYEIPGLSGQRGYTGKGREKAKDANTPDLKEFWQCGQTVLDDDPVKHEYPDNIMVSELPKFNEIVRKVYAQLEETGMHLLRAISVYLNLPETYFDAHVHNGNSILRALHYFPIDNPDAVPPDAVRSAAHEDINLITLLIGASADGLEVLTRDNTWFPVKAQGEDIVVNVGDMLQRLTNNVLKSTTHRVVNPPRELLGTSRFSVPFFLHPKSHMDLTCLDSCITEDNPKHYSNMTAGEYLDERLREIGLKM
jgi:isopenicillin N synthase-like dioxygenase